MNHLLRIVAAIFMIATAWFASENAEFLEYLLVDAGWSNWFLSAYISRILTGSSMALGVLLIFLPGNGKLILRSSLILSLGMLLLSILQPVSLGLTRCYTCLSEVEKVSRYQGIYLWLGVVLLIAAALYSFKGIKSFLPAWTAWVILIGGMSIPFILNYPASWAIYGEVAETPMQRNLQLERLDTVQFEGGNMKYSSEIWEKKQLLVLASLSCPFCTRASYKLHIIRKQNPDFPVVIMLTGDTVSLSTFVKRTRIDNVPYLLFNGPVFNDLCEGHVPRLFIVEKGQATKEITYWGLTDKSLAD